MSPNLSRRDALKALGAGSLVGTAGCLGTLGFETQSAWRDPPLVEDRPNAVYRPALTEGMKTYGTTTTGPYGVALTYSYPHRFWTLTGTELTKTVVESDDSLHLMVSLWDRETRTVLPLDSGVTIEITRDGSLVTEELAYPMLSQQMGLHYGSNYVLEGEGEYEATVSVGGVSLDRTGAFAGRFESAQTASFAFTFDTDDLHDVPLNRLEDAGERGAVEPMDMGFPVGVVPKKDALPGRHLGRATSGDAVFHAFAAKNRDSRFGDFDGTYLYLSARTPHNRIALPMMGLTATLTRDGETAFEGSLARTLDPELGYHYGAGVGEVRGGDTLEVTVDVPPQIARHDGYETAFLDMPPVTFEVSE
ncbi:DUF7350 domain-containing protein [Halopelagius longus]|uniref:Iron transporter n=1 Tax=Halopelagius longus TaxID=1236180 RepID=A0A1H0YUI9_9EURY|nr:iron transporter [Halopelagius longus]RDI72683.1 iron transporter [Halopelagius longus]SDQ18804.1 hypothetical protein SAMN05216278_0850 [Halopelagius longus]